MSRCLQVMKGFPWYHERMLDDFHQAELESWGFNALRLGTMWSGIEPEEGQYNQTYLNIIQVY